MTVHVHVDVQHADGVDARLTSDDIAGWIALAASAVQADGAREVSVRVVEVAEMQQLNSEFRGIDKATNVLSFPAGEIDGLPADAGVVLGDLVVCASVVNKEASEQGKTATAHWAHMIVHGTLHLLGFDHVDETEAAEMESLEIRILANQGIANPYGEPPART